MLSPAVIPIGDPEWHAFVVSCHDATAFHRPEWAGMLGDCFGFPAFAVVLRATDGSIRAGLPVVEAGRLRSRRWISLPFTDSCEPLGETGLVPRLAEGMDELRAAAGVRGGEIRAVVESRVTHLVRRGFLHTLPLGPDPEVVFRTFDRTQVQQRIRKAVREGVVVRRSSDPADVLGTFYKLHLMTRRRQGVPIQPQRFFGLLWERIIDPGLGFVLVAEREGRPQAAGVFLAWNSTLVYKYGASDPDRRSSRPNHALLWEAVRWGCSEGYELLDFGRTDLGHEGLRSFKAGWGTTEIDLRYSSLGAAVPERAGRSRAALSAIIRRSPPWVCRLIGERLYRYAA